MTRPLLSSTLATVVALAATTALGACALEQTEDHEPAATAGAEQTSAAEPAANDQADADRPDAGDEPAGDRGSRANPLALGETVEGHDWQVTVDEVTVGADEAVAAANQFNDPAPGGHSYALIALTATYTGTDSETPMLGVSVDWVTQSGETLSAFDSFVVAPDAFDAGRELYEGGTESGNVVIAVPDGDDGLVRIRLGLFDRDDFFYVVD